MSLYSFFIQATCSIHICLNFCVVPYFPLHPFWGVSSSLHALQPTAPSVFPFLFQYIIPEEFLQSCVVPISLLLHVLLPLDQRMSSMHICISSIMFLIFFSHFLGVETAPSTHGPRKTGKHWVCSFSRGPRFFIRSIRFRVFSTVSHPLLYSFPGIMAKKWILCCSKLGPFFFFFHLSPQREAGNGQLYTHYHI